MVRKTIVQATLLAGTLDILSAFIFSGMNGIGPARVLRGVATGPFGDGMRDAGLAGAALGLAVHFAIMAVIVAIFVTVVRRWPSLFRTPLLTGVAAGLVIYGVMYWIVLPLRWPQVFPMVGAWQVGNALFSMIVCVGIPIALVTAAHMGRDSSLGGPARAG